MLIVSNMTMESSTVRNNKGTIKCDKNTVTCDIGTIDTVFCLTLIHMSKQTPKFKKKKKKFKNMCKLQILKPKKGNN